MAIFHVTSRSALGMSILADPHPQAPYIKIFSDVDDTLYCSGGDGIAGLDNSFPRKVVYPVCLLLIPCAAQT